jgi:enamine deaminase RidA (YjgF/YER057c/UK114 family)
MPIFIEIFGDQSVSPLPVALRSGDMVRGFRIVGTDPNTGELGKDIGTQLKNAHQNMKLSIESVGGTTANIAQVSMYFQDFGRDREAMNPPWVDAFPDESDRPTYKFLTANLPGDELVYMDYFAVLNQPRQVLNIPGVAHTNPIPLGVKMGPYLFSSRVLPYDPGTGKPPEGVEAQAEHLFNNVEALLKTGGMSWSDVKQGRAFVADLVNLPLVTRRWEKLFPDASTCPVLHPLKYGGGALQVMLEIIASEDN